MKIIGTWSNPLSVITHRELIEKAARKSEGRCQYCGFQCALTETNPTGGLHACVAEAGKPAELHSVVTLCGFCANLNNLENMKDKGVFVELPYIKQGELINILRIIYCVQSSTNDQIMQTRIYQGSTALLQELTRIPAEWKSLGFDGSVDRILMAQEVSKGYSEAILERQNYVDRLRFLFRPEPFLIDIQRWLPTIESQVSNAE